MNTDRPIHRAPRLAAAVLLGLGTLALAPAVAHAEPGKGQGQGQTQPPGQELGQDQGQSPAGSSPAPAAQTNGNGLGKGKGKGSDKGSGSDNEGRGNGDGKGHGNGHGSGTGGHGNQQADGHAHGAGGKGVGASSTPHDPAGNNGTVKIAPLGDFDGIPDNTPHPGCTFLVEWYGFDEGADIVSTVSFQPQAPTADVVIGAVEPSQVFVGEDPASGAGTDSGLDARQAYTLSFTGAPHPQQGYHVTLTIHTPRSIGNDTKSKVFWVTGCAPTSTGTAVAPGRPAAPSRPVTEVAPAVAQAPEQAPDVLGEQAFAPAAPTLPQVRPAVLALPQSQQELPTAVNAGAAGSGAPASGTVSLLGLLLVLLGAVSARLGWTRARG